MSQRGKLSRFVGYRGEFHMTRKLLQKHSKAFIPAHNSFVENIKKLQRNMNYGNDTLTILYAPKIILLLAVITISVILSSCTENIAYRQIKLAQNTGLTDCAFGSAFQNKGEKGNDYYLGFVEVDDQGVFFSRDQFNNLACELTKVAESSGILISVFVHGWHHNAAPGDKNIEKFEQSLATLSQLEHLFAKEKDVFPRKTIGIYVGWRGESLYWPLISNLTFWERKNTAEEIARRSVSEALLRLENIRNIQPLSLQPNRLFIVGHSFGADVVYNALSPIMLERLVNYEKRVCDSGMIKGFGDFVFLINPAFESLQYINFMGLLSEKNSYCPNQFPVFAILTSLQDEATKFAFPLGRKLSTLFETYRDIKIEGQNGEKIIVNQRTLDTTAIGHEEILFTHELKNNGAFKPTTPEEKLTENECDIMRDLRNGWMTEQKKYVLNDVVFTPTSQHHLKNPYLVIRVDEEIIPDHNDIYSNQVLNFMRRLVVISTHEEVCADP
jgi:hypothetical protein